MKFQIYYLCFFLVLPIDTFQSNIEVEIQESLINQFKDQIMFYMQRHKVKPGITGWAQINGWRGETDTLMKMQKRVECDLFYIDNWSILFDLYIILLTFFRGFIHKNAY